MKFPQGPPSISMIGFPARKEYLLQSEAVRCQQKIKKPLTTYGNMVTTVILHHLLMGSAFDKTREKKTNSSEATTTRVHVQDLFILYFTKSHKANSIETVLKL